MREKNGIKMNFITSILMIKRCSREKQRFDYPKIQKGGLERATVPVRLLLIMGVFDKFGNPVLKSSLHIRFRNLNFPLFFSLLVNFMYFSNSIFTEIYSNCIKIMHWIIQFACFLIRDLVGMNVGGWM